MIRTAVPASSRVGGVWSLLPVGLGLLLVLLVAPAAIADDPRARLEAIEADLEALEERLQQSRRDRDSLDEEIRRSDLALAELATDVRATEDRLRTTRTELEGLETELEALEARQQQTLQALRAEMRQSWLLARRGPLQTLLEADAPDRVARLLALHEFLARARLQAQAEHRQAARALSEARATVAATRDTLLDQRDLMERQVAGLQRVRAERQRLLAELEADIDSGVETRAELETERDALRDLIDRLDVERFDGTGESFAALRGSLPWPISADQLERRPDADDRTGGMLLAAREGSTVRAIHAGRVVFADWMRGFGLLVIVDHGGGYMSLYGQAEALLRNVGDVVAPGDGLATTGRSGGSSRAGVWFGIRKDGRPESPRSWCESL